MRTISAALTLAVTVALGGCTLVTAEAGDVTQTSARLKAHGLTGDTPGYYRTAREALHDHRRAVGALGPRRLLSSRRPAWRRARAAGAQA
jgi:dihydrodipicolinate synthase/N-acetylneuraminate lyase